MFFVDTFVSYYIVLQNFTEQGIKSLKVCIQSIEIRPICKEQQIGIILLFIH